jgi:hypothetical protein
VAVIVVVVVADSNQSAGPSLLVCRPEELQILAATPQIHHFQQDCPSCSLPGLSLVMEPRRSTRARAREEAAPAPTPEPSKETASKVAPKSLKRKRTTGAAKESTPGTPVSESRQQPLKPTLPVKVVEGQPLPTLSEPQPVDLPSHAYQSVQQRYVVHPS